MKGKKERKDKATNETKTKKEESPILIRTQVAWGGIKNISMRKKVFKV